MGASGLALRIKDAGVVGAGGAGFPTHIKAEAKAEIVIANGAECEPLLQKDKEIMRTRAEAVLAGLELMVSATGAAKGVLGVKAKHKELVSDLKKLIGKRKRLELKTLGDYYPAGDEFSLVYEVTGKLIPPGGIPIQIGAVVSNVETLANIAAGEPVTETSFTVAGAVNSPCTVTVPVGSSFAEAIDLAGGPTLSEFSILDGGAMMGKVATDASKPVTKTTGGLIVLPKDHILIRRKSAPRSQYTQIGRSACDQCSFCTEFCPRYLLGYDIQPHQVMKGLGFAPDKKKLLNEWALLCCECSLCSLYACPENLDPKNICVSTKGDLRGTGVTWKEAALNAGKAPKPHPMLEYRKVPISRLTQRLGLDPYKADAPLLEERVSVKRVVIPLKQHVGAPAVAAVAAGKRVRKGDLIGEIPEGRLGARVHASIDGKVQSVGESVVIEA